MKQRIPLLLILTLALLLAGCQAIPGLSQPGGLSVTVEADRRTQTLTVPDGLSVIDVLKQAGITPGDLDRVNPPTYSRVTDGMTITVVRVTQQIIQEQESVPFQSRTVPNDGLPAGKTRMLQAGVNGLASITYRVTYENGVEMSRSEINRVLITPPQDEVVMVGSQGELPTVTVNGTVVYMSSGNAWIIRQNSANRRPLTSDGGLDGKVFDLSADGKRLLFTLGPVQQTSAGEENTPVPTPTPRPDQPFNTLWVIWDTTDLNSQPVRLDLQNVLYAAWLPGAERTIVFSTAEPRPSFPGWQANNDLWRAQISANGGVVQRTQLLEELSGGIYGWFGTAFAFSPDGVALAWAQPDAVGALVPQYTPPEGPTPTPTPKPTPTSAAGLGPTPFPTEALPFELPTFYTRRILASFAPWNAYDFVWRPGLSWSPDGTLVATTTHGAPLGSESPEDSPVFDVTIFQAEGGYSVNAVAQAGMWADPQYSPGAAPDGTPLDVHIAYLQALDPLDSVQGRYQLAIMDRDGSNSQVIFPAPDKPGLLPQNIAWSPDGRQIALVDPGPEGNLMLVDVVTGLAQQLTTDLQSSNPRWAP